MTTRTRRFARRATLLATALTTLAATQNPPAATRPAKAATGGDDAPLPLTLTRVVETRSAEPVAHETNNEGVLMMAAQQPALMLTFTLKLPHGVHLMSVDQPAKVTAADSTGADLTSIDAALGGKVEYLDVEHDYKDDDDRSEITMHLAPSKRTATTFDASAAFTATVYTGSKPVSIELDADWKTLPPGTVDLKGQCRLKATDDGVTIEPAEMQKWIEKIEIQIGPKEVIESNGWMSDGSIINYMFDDLPKQRPLKVTLTVRTGVKTVPLAIDVKKQALP